MRYNGERTQAEKAYVTGIETAESKGFAAGSDLQFKESDNPYKRFEHRTAWIDGFRRARSKTE